MIIIIFETFDLDNTLAINNESLKLKGEYVNIVQEILLLWRVFLEMRTGISSCFWWIK